MSSKYPCGKPKEVAVGTQANGFPIKIKYLEKGKSNSVRILFVDPYLGKEAWIDQLNEFSEHYHVIAIDLFGYACETPRPTCSETYSYEWLARQIMSFITIKEFWNPIFVGVDTAVGVGIKYQSLFGENAASRFSGIVIVNGSAGPVVTDDPCLYDVSQITTAEAAALASAFSADPITTAKQMVSTFFGTNQYPTAVEVVKNYAAQRLSRMDPAIMNILFNKTFTENLLDELAKIYVPVQVIYSYMDESSKCADSRFFRRVASTRVPYCTGCASSCTNPHTYGIPCNVIYADIKDKTIFPHVFSTNKFNYVLEQFVSGKYLKGKLSKSFISCISKEYKV